ncbi:hypothetical protein [Alteraurantiacibacter palmitatis]|uniref:AcrB/AcrD/AcrF family protein n=1 Tax=Alteraurantiacibacter palmitatis TaxID=2054628 RepID=A0ABV7E9G8_9SPHN
MSSPASARFPLVLCLGLWAAAWALQLWMNRDIIAGWQLSDPDDFLRLVQVRDLLAGQSWFDLTQHRINPPAGTLMHWSRLVDLPLAGVIVLLTPLIGAQSAEQAAMVIVPALTLLALVMIAGRLTALLAGRTAAILACVGIVFQPMLGVQLRPLRIDHHGWQIVCVMLALYLLLRHRGAKGAALAGAALAVGLAVSLEVLALAAGFGLVCLWRWMMEEDRRSLPAFLASLAATSAAILLATRGPGDLAAHCDQISPPYLLAMGSAALAAFAVSRTTRATPLLHFVLLAAAGLAGLAAFLISAPYCTAGPFAMLDPLVRDYWYVNVVEGQPIWRGSFGLVAPALLAALVGLGVMIWQMRTGKNTAQRAVWREYLTVFAVTVATGLLVLRTNAMVGAMALPPTGLLAAGLLARAVESARPLAKFGHAVLIAALLAPVIPAAMVLAALPQLDGSPKKAPAVSQSQCALAQSAAKLDHLPAGLVFAPLDVGPQILSGSRHAVVATAHHRAADAMHDVIAAFIAAPPEAEAIVRGHGADYLLICHELAEPRLYARRAPDGLAARLAAGEVPAWLEPLDIGLPPGLSLYRVTPLPDGTPAPRR